VLARLKEYRFWASLARPCHTRVTSHRGKSRRFKRLLVLKMSQIVDKVALYETMLRIALERADIVVNKKCATDV